MLWERALASAKKNGVNLSLLAAGFPTNNKMPNWTLASPSLIASGQKGKGITKEMKLWPQDMNQTENRIVIAGLQFSSKFGYSFPDGTFKRNIDYFVKLTAQNPQQQVYYSSLAVSIAAAELVNNCEKYNSECYKNVLLPRKTIK